MSKHPPSAYLLVVLAMGVPSGCGEPSSQPPVKIETDESAAPLPPAQEAGPAEISGQREHPVRQAAHLEEADDGTTAAASVPQVLLTKQHEALVRAKVGDKLPAIELPKLDGGRAKLADLYGAAATVVVFWKSDRQMSRIELADLGPDVVDEFSSRGVAVVGIAVEESAADARNALQEAKATFPNLLDADGEAFAKVGAERLPWTLVLDADGKIVWFDLEYSHATRRELRQALLATVK